MTHQEFSQTKATLPTLNQLHKSVHKALEKQTPQKTFDVIVLGVGSMGSATCFQLAKRGYSVLGLEQFSISHEYGSHTGQSRLIRKAYFEHSDYVPLLERAYQNWADLEVLTGQQVYYRTGLLYFAKPDSELMLGVRESANRYNLPLETLDTEGVLAKYPQFNLPTDFEKLLEPDAGFITPERAILLYVQEALRLGATIRAHEKTLNWVEKDGFITVKTDKGTYSCKKLIITAGAWAGKWMPQLVPKLTVTRQVLAWVQPKKSKLFALGTMPSWVIADETKASIFYGMPALPKGKFGDLTGIKLGYHYHGEVSNPDAVNRQTNDAEEQELIQFLQKYMPDGCGKMLALKTCLYTNTPDEHFILDVLPDSPNVVIAAGFSGHGFKFASVIGEIMADLAIDGRTNLPIGFLNMKRLL